MHIIITGICVVCMCVVKYVLEERWWPGNVVVWGRCSGGGDSGRGVSRWGEMSITRAERTRLFGKRQRRPVAKGEGVRVGYSGLNVLQIGLA